MKAIIALAGILIAVSPGLASAEGNGPDFPGLQVPDVQFGTNGTTVHMSHRSDSGYEPRSAFASAVTPDGVVTAQNFPGPNSPPSRTAMLGDMSGPN